MSDQKKDFIHFGSLEHQIKYANGKSVKERGQAAVQAGIRAGNINISGEEAEILELSSISRESVRRNEEVKRKIAASRRAREVIVPTNDKKVRLKLRKLGHPICLFGEEVPDRRERLRQVLAELPEDVFEAEAGRKKVRMDESDDDDDDGASSSRRKVVYSAGGPELKAFRMKLVEDSLRRAQTRVAEEKTRYETIQASEDAGLKDQAQFVERMAYLGKYENNISEVGDIRPISSCAIAADNQHILTGSWSGEARLWRKGGGKHVYSWKGIDDRLSDAIFHPLAFSGNDEKTLNVVTACVDRTIRLWSLEGLTQAEAATQEVAASKMNGGMDTEGTDAKHIASSTTHINRKPLAVLEGHEDRLARVVFHPAGRHIISSSFDETWRVWDLERSTEVLVQDGHARGIYGLDIHPDGALVASGDLGGHAILWDLRSGQNVLALVGHVKKVLSIDFADNGYLLATGSEDNTARIWDIRTSKTVHTIAAHTKSITSVRFQRGNDTQFLTTASHDATVRIWNTVNAGAVSSLTGHSGPLTRVDVSPDSSFIVSSSLDRTWKLWSMDN